MERFEMRCTDCGKHQPFTLKSICKCGGTLLVSYDLEYVQNEWKKRPLIHRPPNMWRYAELLPMNNQKKIISLGEGATPLIQVQAAEKTLPLKSLWVKREEQNPTGSFKSRGFSAAVSLAHEAGIRKIAVNSNGNAASALAAYAARARMEATVFVPKDCPKLIVWECASYGAKTYEVDGFIHDAGKIIEDGKDEQGWYSVGTLKEPGRVEGKKTMGLELAEQFDWNLPNVIIYPTGGGSGIIGMWKAFQELREMNMIQGELPKLVSVQEEGCHPLVDAIDTGLFTPQPNELVYSLPTGMRVPDPPNGKLLLSIIQNTNGTAVSVRPEQIRQSQDMMGRHGISASPEGAAAWAGMLKLCDAGWIKPTDQVVVFNTSHAMKYLPWNLNGSVPTIKDYADFKSLQLKP